LAYDAQWVVTRLFSLWRLRWQLSFLWQHRALLRVLSERDRQDEEKRLADLAAIRTLLQTAIDQKANTVRLVTGIAESLIPTLRILTLNYHPR
jgi:hypothetical protein